MVLFSVGTGYLVGGSSPNHTIERDACKSAGLTLEPKKAPRTIDCSQGAWSSAELRPPDESSGTLESGVPDQRVAGCQLVSAPPRLVAALIAASGLGKDAGIIDGGGGASTLVDFLLDDGHTRLAVLDLSGNGKGSRNH